MKILIVSDTHRRDGNLREIIEKQSPFDMLIHLGDTEGSEAYFKEWVNNDNCVIRVVRGNNDFFSDLPREEIIEVGNNRIFVTHGHYYGVSMDVSGVVDEARNRGCNIALFGHTHKPFLEDIDGILTLNPGSLTYPRQRGRRPSYAVLEMDEKGKMTAEIRYL